MKSYIHLLLLLFFPLLVKAQHEEHKKTIEKSQTEVLSPHTNAMAVIGGAHIHIDYSSPRVRDRIVFGGLVGYNTVWQAGAHRATWFETDKDLLIGEQKLPSGRYAFFLIPGKEKWTVIFNSRWDQHGKDEYNEAENVIRLDVPVQTLEKLQEELTYEIEKKDSDEGIFSFAWEKKKLILPFKVANN